MRHNLIMKKESKFFLVVLIAIILLFFLTGFSLIMCFITPFNETELLSHILEISYLFIHLAALAIVFYITFRAFRFSSVLLMNIMINKDGSKATSKQIIFAILSAISLLVGIYSTLVISNVNLPLNNFFSFVIWHDLMNAFYLLFVIFLTFTLYPIFALKKVEAK